MKKHSWAKWLLISLLFTIIIYGISFVFFNKKTIVFESMPSSTVDYKSSYDDSHTKAYERWSLLPFYKKEVPFTRSGHVDTTKLGSYILRYKVDQGNLKKEVIQNVRVVDREAPKIQLTHKPNSYTPIGHDYQEEGFTCMDNYDGDLTKQVKKEIKDGVVYYSVQDSSGNTTKVERKIIYDDRKGPQIQLLGGKEIQWPKGQKWVDTYQAIDDVDGDVTKNVRVSGTVNVNQVGDYNLSYQVEDAHHNKTELKRIVHVVEPSKMTKSNEKTIYLTFDDGPSRYTEELLAILAKNQVKATFFTTSCDKTHLHMIRKEAEAGHTIALHTYTHNYQKIYSSKQAFWKDFYAQMNTIKSQTGKGTKLFRFAGGSSNTVSRNYTKGIMRELVKEITLKGYVYFDWNVSSGDAGSTTSSDGVYNNVIRQIKANTKYHYPSVVLQHDTKLYSIRAVERIIKWGKANGYTFATLDTHSFAPHHPVAN